MSLKRVKMFGLTFALIVVYLLALYVYAKIKYRFANKIPSIEPMVPFFGNGLEFAQKNCYKIFVNLKRVFENNKHHRLFKLCFGPIVVLCPTHPDLIQKVMTDTGSMEKPYVYEFLRVDLGLLSAKCKLKICLMSCDVIKAFSNSVTNISK